MSILKSVNLGEDIAIDLGSSHISIYTVGRGLVLSEASCAVFDKSGKLIAAGDEAAKFEGKAPETVKIVRPVQGGVVTDIDITGALLAELLKKVRKNMLIKPRIMVSVPYGLTDVEEKAVISAVMRAGARQVIIISAPAAAALGAGCDISIARGLMVLDIGAEKSGMAAISVCTAVGGNSAKLAGNAFTEDIKEFFRRRYSLEIGSGAAESLKKKLSVSGNSLEKTEICGMDASTRLPRKLTFSLAEADGIFDDTVKKIADMIKDTLDIIPAEILGDIMEDGILLVGGGAKLGGLAERLSSLSGIKLYPARDIELCTIKGTGLAFENIKNLPNIAQSYHNL